MASDSKASVAHHVFFTLNDPSDQNIAAMVIACHRYLDDHPGVIYFSVGTRCPELNRPVNDQEFHVSLHVVFEDMAAHDLYQVAPRHLQFIEENKPSWKSVRVCDSYLQPL